MRNVIYDRGKAVEYAKKWALKRNPRFYDFEEIGGDCTNFISQCIYAGAEVMNYTPVMGWFYNSVYNRSPSWTGVQYLYNFLISNTGVGPYASASSIEQLEIGDVIQLGDQDNRFYHSLFITKIDGTPTFDTIYVSTHTFDANLRPLNSYFYSTARYIHIRGVRKY